ncbi:MAG TPA: TlpA disulfide reductase family protein [Patescibacteria group bacterium]|nr:TlpA disulfide reductase family protein [Patescibacteria group bacterium]
MNRVSSGATVALAGATLAGLLLFAGGTGAATTGAVGDDVKAGAPLPVISATGDTVDLRAELAPAPPAGKTRRGATLLVFWATWCKPCMHEVPEIREVGRFYAPQGLRIVSVATTWKDDSLEKILGAAKDNGIDYEVLYDMKDSAREAFEVRSLPTTILIDGRGVVTWRGNVLPADINERVRAALGPIEDSGAK